MIEGDVQVVQRSQSLIRAQQIDNGQRFEGYVRWNSEELILQASDPILAVPIVVNVHEDPALSYVVGTQVDATTTCESIITDQSTLFWVPEGSAPPLQEGE